MNSDCKCLRLDGTWLEASIELYLRDCEMEWNFYESDCESKHIFILYKYLIKMCLDSQSDS